MDNVLDSTKHEVKLLDRGLIYLTGIERIVSFDANDFLMESVMGSIELRGEGLEIVKMDTHDGVVTIKGVINSFVYEEDTKKNTESFWGKLFK